MPYDPDLPTDNAVVSAPELRAQFQGLQDQIDSLTAALATMQTLVDTKVDIEQVNIALSDNTAGSFAGLDTLDDDLSDPVTREEIVQIKNKLNQTINMGKRV